MPTLTAADHGYVGRFAPSPTGPLHFGSLVAALGSCLEAHRHGGRWLVRMEDVDEPRCSRVVGDGILATLERFGFVWDGEVIWQSRRTAAYQEALATLRDQGLLYPCACTRRELGDASPAIDGAARYPGTCRDGLPPGRSARAWRLRVTDEEIRIDDAVQGAVVQRLASDVGDFVLLRADGYVAYQLAVVVDDAMQGVTDVVRGSDLLDSTPRQVWLQRCLGLPTPDYLHLPVAVDGQGEKLSKQTGARALDAERPGAVLVAALQFLGQSPPADLVGAGAPTVWQWAREHWAAARIPRCRTIRTES
jgi:glutamyl-Q tRNA(Asp) synthetase